QRIGKTVERIGADIGDDLVAVGEIAIQPHRTAPEPGRDIPNGNPALTTGGIQRGGRMPDPGPDPFEVFTGELARHGAYLVRIRCTIVGAGVKGGGIGVSLLETARMR